MADIGNIGQKLFSAWCSQVGIIATPPDEDKRGWDYLVESAGRDGLTST
jgi:hypothetical protein